MTPVRLSLLGTFQVAAPAALPVKARALLAYLAVCPGTFHLRDKLAALLWGDTDDARARDSLRHVMTLFRKTLSADGLSAIVEREQAFALNPAVVDVDVVAFERLAAGDGPEAWRAAAECYRGDLLEGLVVSAAGFEEWLLPERERLREIAIETLARLLAFQTRALTSPEELDDAVETASRLLALDPMQEAVHRALMRLHARRGRRSAALRQYQTCVTVLRRDLGADPEQETRRLYEEILQERVGAPARSPSEIPVAVVKPLLRGRETELHAIHQGLGDLANGRGRALMVLGEAGIGKTALLNAVTMDVVDRHALMLHGRSYESTQGLPFGPWVQALRGGGITAAHEGLAALEPVWRTELTRLLPELADPTLPRPSADIHSLFESVAQLILALSHMQPVVLTIDDLHWADESSLRLLAFVVRRIAPSPILIAATARTEDLHQLPVLKAIVEELEREPEVTLLRPLPLSRHETATLTRDRLRAGTSEGEIARVAEQVWMLSSGNPHLATEVLKSLSESARDRPAALSLADSVRDMISARLDRLSEGGRRLVTTAAIIRREFDFLLVQRASGMTPYEAAEAMEEVVRRGVIDGVQDGFDFVHDRVREIAYGRILQERRRILHGLVAQAIEELYADELDPHVTELASHFESAGDRIKAALYLRLAGGQAATRSAYREAAAFFTRGISALDRAQGGTETTRLAIDLRLDLRNMLLPLGDFGRVIACLKEADGLAQQLGDHSRLTRISCYMTQFFCVSGHYEAATQSGERALSLAEKLDDVGMRAEAAFFLGTTCCCRGDYARATEVLGCNADLLVGALSAQRFGLPFLPSIGSRVFLAWALSERGEFDAAMVRARESAAIAEASNDPFGLVESRFAPGFVQVRRGEFAAAVQTLEQAVEDCRAAQIPLLFPFGASHLGLARAYTGRAPEGIALLDEAIAQADAMHLVLNRSRWVGMLAEACLAAGKVSDASEQAARALELSCEYGERGHEAWALRLLGNVAAAQGDAAKAEEYYQACSTLANDLGMPPLIALVRFDKAAWSARTECTPATESELRTTVRALNALGMAGWCEPGILALSTDNAWLLE